VGRGSPQTDEVGQGEGGGVKKVSFDQTSLALMNDPFFY